jgi:hypothetical protein
MGSGGTAGAVAIVQVDPQAYRGYVLPMLNLDLLEKPPRRLSFQLLIDLMER